MVVKIVNDALVEMLGAEAETINLNATPPVPILMVGLQGSGKTTTTAKIARRLKERDKKRVLMASLDTPPPGGDGATRRSGRTGRGRYAAHRHRTAARRRSRAAPWRRGGLAAMTW